MCGIRRHGYNGCDCSFTYGETIPCCAEAQGPYTPLLVVHDPNFYNLNEFSRGMEMRHISLTIPNCPYHPVQWHCDTITVEKVEPPEQLCPLHGFGTPKKPAETPQPKLDPAAKKMMDEMDVNINALLRKQ